MKEKTLDEKADELLEEYARQRGVSLRELGVLNRNRQAWVARKEIPFSTLFHRRRRGSRQGEND